MDPLWLPGCSLLLVSFRAAQMFNTLCHTVLLWAPLLAIDTFRNLAHAVVMTVVYRRVYHAVVEHRHQLLEKLDGY